MKDIPARYAKGIVATITAGAAWLVGTGTIDPGQEQTLVASLIGLSTVFGVILVPNKAQD